MKQTTRIITVAGTKGKTTCVRALHYAINAVQEEPVLGVDTHKIMLGNEMLMEKEDYTNLSGMGMALCPGRSLLALKGQRNPVAVLEASLGSWRTGLGYGTHEIGIFTNVFDDHIHADGTISSRERLAEAKASYIFQYIGENGTAIYNADNDLVPTQLDVIPSGKNITYVACTLKNTTQIQARADYVVTIRDGRIIVLNGDTEVLSDDAISMPWLYGGKHEPSLYDAMFVVAALWRFYRNEPTKLQQALNVLTTYVPDPNGGRMVVRTADNGAKVIIDFAHERESLKHIAEFARKLIPAGGKVIGVLRMNNARDDEHIKRSTDYFAGSYDKLLVYDPAGNEGEYGRMPGEVPQIIADVARAHHVPTEIILDDEEALKMAYKESSKDTAIVYIFHNQYTAHETADGIFHFERED